MTPNPNPNHDELYDLQDIAVEVHDATDTYTYALDHLDPDPYDEPDIAGQEALDL